MTNKKIIRGSGGGSDDSGGDSYPDSLKSTAYVRILDLLGEGEIEGLVDGEKSIYINETPLQAQDGSRNFQNVTWEMRTGTQSQSYMTSSPGTEAETAVGTELKDFDLGAVTMHVSDVNATRARVRFVTPAFFNTGDDGKTGGTGAYVQLQVKPSGGSFTTQASRVLFGKASSRYEFELSVPLNGDGPWDIRALRVPGQLVGLPYPVSSYTTPAVSTDDKLQNHIFVDAITEVVDLKLRYPNSALVGIRFDAQQFSSIPSRFYDVKLLKVKVPTNYDPTTRTYSGTWDGTFKIAWTDNPAWVFYDLVTTERYGLGSFLPEDQVDKWGLYEIGKYCDGTVPDGFGGFEPRFTCNMLVSDAVEAYTLLQSLASVFRGMIYWASNTVTVSQDAPQDPAYLFTPANVIDGRFSYQGASAKARHSVALITWNDPVDFYRPKVEYVEDQDAISKFGIQSTSVTAFGCTSRGQAHRLGKWLLYTEQFESEMVVFKTGLDGIVSRPGQVVKIADPVRAGVRMGGRISSATTTEITIDNDISGAIGGNTFSIMLPNGAIEDRIVTGYAGRVITVQPALSQAPQSGAMWILRSDEVEPQTYRVIGITEEEGGIFSVNAIRHDPDKFAAIESGIVLEPKSYSDLKAITDPPKNIKMTESLYQSNTEVKAKITVSWDRVDRATAYGVSWRRDQDNWVDLPQSSFNDAEILDVVPGIYSVRVFAINALGKFSAIAEFSQEAYGKTIPPGDVQGFSLIPNAGHAYLSWDQAADLDVLVGGQIRVRYTPLTTGQEWKNSVDVVPAIPGNSTTLVAPLLSGTYMAKFIDSSGNYSQNEALIVTTVPEALALNVVHTETENPSFAGLKTQMQIDDPTGYLVLGSTTLFDAVVSLDGIGDFDLPGDIASLGTYDFSNTVDLGSVYPTRVTISIDLEAFDIGNLIDQRVDLMDTWQDIDGQVVNDVNATMYMRTTEDNPSGAPAWTSWKPIIVGDYSMRGAQFQLRCTSGTLTHNLFIKSLAVTLDMPDRALQMGPITSGTGSTYRVTYPEPFWETPSIAITANALGTGDFYTITSSDVSGFDIVFKNAGGTIVSRVFNLIAKGYGRRVA